MPNPSAQKLLDKNAPEPRSAWEMLPWRERKEGKKGTQDMSEVQKPLPSKVANGPGKGAAPKKLEKGIDSYCAPGADPLLQGKEERGELQRGPERRIMGRGV